MPARRGVLLFVLLLAALGVLVLIATLRLRGPSSGSPTASVVLTLDVPSVLPETSPPYRFVPSFASFRRSRMTVFELTHGIRRAATDDRVRGLVLHLGSVDWGWARIAEVRDAILRFRAAGKPVYAGLSDASSEAELLVASAADVVSLPPTANLAIDGLTLSALFFRGTFDKVGITPNFAHIGRYKSAAEAYTRTGMSEDARASFESLLEDDFRGFVDSLAASRHLPRDSVVRLVDHGPFTAREALAAGLVDTLIYDAELDSLAMRRGPGALDRLRFSRWLDRQSEPGGSSRIALVVAAGAIVPGRSRESAMNGLELGSETLCEALREARRRSSIRAVVLRIDSPGGVSSASDEIWREVERCRRVKPVIVSMSDYAASGGYYIAAPADSIVAEPGTITGSIGVFGGKLNVLGLYRKLGLNVETVSRGRHAGMFSSVRDFTPEEATRYEAMLDTFYRGFVQRVAAGRRMRTAQVDSIGQGRVWSGSEARAIGLVDRLGGLDAAIEMARARAHMPVGEPAIEHFPRVTRSLVQRMLEGLFDEDDEESDAELASLPPVVLAWLAASRIPSGTVLALLPWSLEIR